MAKEPMVMFRCKHSRPVKNMLARDCPKCLQLKRDAQSLERKKARAAKGRLPDGAVFMAEYDAQSQCWDGTLTVSGQVFRLTKKGVFSLMGELDYKYRKWLKEKEASK